MRKFEFQRTCQECSDQMMFWIMRARSEHPEVDSGVKTTSMSQRDLEMEIRDIEEQLGL